MKINEYGNIAGMNPNTAGVGSTQEQKHDEQISFAEQISLVLQKVLQEATSKQAVREIEELSNKNSVIGNINHKVAMTTVNGPDTALPHRQAVLALEDLLNMLEEYEAALADPTASLKDLHPLVQDMQQKAQRLQDSLPQMEHSLTPLANQIISQAQVESIKFQRGDYI